MPLGGAGGSVENQRAITLLFIVGGVLAGIFLRSLTGSVLGYGSWPDPLLGGVVTASTLAAAAGGVVAFLVAIRNERATTFADSVISELKKVTWPTREETTGNTGVVVGATIFFSLLLAAYDFAWAELTSQFLYVAP